MKHTIGSPLAITADRATAHFKTSDETWTLPVIGWAIVVSWNGEPDNDDPGEQETHIEAVVLTDDGHLRPLSTYTQYDIEAPLALQRIEMDEPKP